MRFVKILNHCGTETHIGGGSKKFDFDFGLLLSTTSHIGTKIPAKIIKQSKLRFAKNVNRKTASHISSE